MPPHFGCSPLLLRPPHQSGAYFDESWTFPQRAYRIDTALNFGGNLMRPFERFLKYVMFDTMSDENSGTVPSTRRARRSWDRPW